ncbi:MAG: hypothetical protein Q8O84_02895 [Nanoarchaeota archaeon]|nr:hypothetical protein [Nanoarchaeota archaeon]
MKNLTKILTTTALAATLGLALPNEVKAQKPAGVAIAYLSSHLNLRKVSLEIDSISTYALCIDSIKTNFKAKVPYMNLINGRDFLLPPAKTFFLTYNKNKEAVIIPVNFNFEGSYIHKDSEAAMRKELKKYVKESFKLTAPVDYGSEEMLGEILQTKRK